MLETENIFSLLERRKLRIRELEERLKEALESNESLQQASQKAERKYEECKEQLDQLEGFQNQELGKVKHMLLSAGPMFDDPLHTFWRFD